MQYLQALLLSWWRSRKSLLSLQGRQEQWVWTRALLGSKLCSKAKCEKKNDGICFQFVTCCNRTCSLLVSAAGCWGGGHWRDSSWHCPWCRGSGFACCLVWTIPHGILLMSHDHHQLVVSELNKKKEILMRQMVQVKQIFRHWDWKCNILKLCSLVEESEDFAESAESGEVAAPAGPVGLKVCSLIKVVLQSGEVQQHFA